MRNNKQIPKSILSSNKIATTNKTHLPSCTSFELLLYYDNPNFKIIFGVEVSDINFDSIGSQLTRIIFETPKQYKLSIMTVH